MLIDYTAKLNYRYHPQYEADFGRIVTKLESHIMNNISKQNAMPPVEFTQRQLDWLNSQYPEKLATANTTDAELRHSAGQRSVILLIQTRLQK